MSCSWFLLGHVMESPSLCKPSVLSWHVLTWDSHFWLACHIFRNTFLDGKRFLCSNVFIFLDFDIMNCLRKMCISCLEWPLFISSLVWRICRVMIALTGNCWSSHFRVACCNAAECICTFTPRVHRRTCLSVCVCAVRSIYSTNSSG